MYIFTPRVTRSKLLSFSELEIMPTIITRLVYKHDDIYKRPTQGGAPKMPILLKLN